MKLVCTLLFAVESFLLFLLVSIGNGAYENIPPVSVLPPVIVGATLNACDLKQYHLEPDYYTRFECTYYDAEKDSYLNVIDSSNDNSNNNSILIDDLDFDYWLMGRLMASGLLGAPSRGVPLIL